MSIFALWMGALAFHSSSAHAESFSRKTKSKALSTSITLGVRYWIHYNRVTNISTPPESLLGEAQLNFWLKGILGIQLFGSTAVSMTPGTYFGAGVRLQAISITSGKAAVVSGFSLMLLADVALFNVAQPIPPQTYEPSGVMIRYGASVNWFLGKGKFFLDTTMSVSTFQGNFFIGPFFGLGMKF
jgi:hypothetical protein